MPLSEVKNIDCMEGMKDYPDKFFDLAIVDPPYGINASKMTMGSGVHLFKKDKDWDKRTPSLDYFTELYRVSKNQIIWGGNYFTEFLPPSKNWIIWDKLNPNLCFAEAELAWVNDGKLARVFKHYSAQVEGAGKIHPTQKPVQLYKYCLKHYADSGYKILDTHLGSGSSRIAAYDMGFDFTGFEIDKDYFEAQEKRFHQHIAQLKLSLI